MTSIRMMTYGNARDLPTDMRSVPTGAQRHHAVGLPVAIRGADELCSWEQVGVYDVTDQTAALYSGKLRLNPFSSLSASDAIQFYLSNRNYRDSCRISHEPPQVKETRRTDVNADPDDFDRLYAHVQWTCTYHDGISMPATERLIVMMDPEDKRALVASAKAQKVSVAKLVRQRLMTPGDPSERAFLEAVVELGERARRVFVEADAREAREAVAVAARPAHEAQLRKRVEAAFEATRAGVIRP